jgi:hypothetical protein
MRYINLAIAVLSASVSEFGKDNKSAVMTGRVVFLVYAASLIVLFLVVVFDIEYIWLAKSRWHAIWIIVLGYPLLHFTTLKGEELQPLLDEVGVKHPRRVGWAAHAVFWILGFAAIALRANSLSS